MATLPRTKLLACRGYENNAISSNLLSEVPHTYAVQFVFTVEL
jgi:hypothetical protein